MHIVMVSDAETQGGAAVAASRLAQALCDVGHEVTRIVNRADGQRHPWRTEVVTLPPLVRSGWRVVPAKHWARLREGLCYRQLHALLRRLRPDTINLHNLHGGSWAGWSPEILAVCTEYAPVAWTLHDMWSFTGRCAYNESCRRFETGCNAACPTPHEYPDLAPPLIAPAWAQRRRLLADHPSVVAVCPSQWLADEAQRGMWQGHRVEVIPYGLPLDRYRPLDRHAARDTLGIRGSGPVLLMAAQGLDDRRKGGALLVEALWHLRRPVTLLTMGQGTLDLNLEGVHLHALGYVADEATKVLAYNAADLFVHPARMDNLPNVVLEAIACGTPVVGFRVGGVPDMVRPGQSGWLAAQPTPDALAATLNEALAASERGETLRASCRTLAEAEYSAALQASRYERLFVSLRAGG